MSTLDVVSKIQTITQNRLNTYLQAATPALPTVDSRNVRIDSVDPTAQAAVVIWILAETSRFEEDSIGDDLCVTTVKVFLIVRGASSGTLFSQLYKTAAFFRQMIGANSTLEGVALDAMVRDFQFYDNVEGAPSSRAVEITIEVSHEEPRG